MLPMLQIQLLGGFQVQTDDGPLGAFDSPRLQTLLAYLILHSATPQPRQQLAFLLWPDSREAQASSNLRTLLHRLGRVLGDRDAFLRSDGWSVQWREDAPCRVDVAAFDSALRAAGEAERRGEQATVREQLAAAVAQYRGDLLPGSYDDWVVPLREQLRQRCLAALERLLLLLEADGDYAAATGYAQQQLRHDPLNEASYRHLMRLHALRGDRASAVSVFHTCRTVLDRELGVEPSPETHQAYERLLVEPPRPEPADDGGAAASITRSAPQLPVALTSFVGRERELAEVERLLSTTHLLTLTGAGGCGKTRLALAVAARCAADHRDGVWLVELAGLADGALVPEAVAAALQLPAEPHRAPIAALVDALRARQLLLVLDNCEHLVDAAARLVEALLSTCSELRILATSREALGIAGELTWAVPSLSLPDRRAVRAEELLRSEAVQLFVDRATAVLPTFALTDETGPGVARACRRLDGIPLAIELAAARVKLLSLAQLNARLDDGIKLLTGGSRTALPRHQTLRAAIDWSYDLLDERQRSLFRRLAVFAGGFSVETAEAVCAGEDIAAADVLELLAYLVDKSLVVVDSVGSRSARYRLLEPLRQYGLEKLGQAGEAQAIEEAYVREFLRIAEEAFPKLRGAEQVWWVNRLELEHDNLLAALQWALDREEAEMAMRISAALWLFWWMHGHLHGGRRLIERTLERGQHDSGVAPTLQARVLQGAGVLADEQGDHLEARHYYEQSLRIRRELGDTKGSAATLNSMGVGAYYQGDYRRAGALLEESLALRRQLGDRGALGVALTNLGLVALGQHNVERAAELFEESLALARSARDRAGLAIALSNLGVIARDQNDDPRAQRLYNESLAYYRELGDVDGIAECLEGLASVAVRRGQAERAARLLGATAAIRSGIGVSLQPAEQARYEQTTAAVRAQLDSATWSHALAEGRALPLEEAIAEARSIGEPRPSS